MLPPSSARDMLMQVKRYADGGEASPRTYSDADVKAFIQATQAQYGGVNAESNKVIADAMAQSGVGVNQVARASGYTPLEVESAYKTQRGGEAPVQGDPTGSAAGSSAAYRTAIEKGGQQTVNDYTLTCKSKPPIIWLTPMPRRALMRTICWSSQASARRT